MRTYDKLFGTPEKIADFIIDNCGCDCLACPFYGAPCCSHYTASEDDRQPLLDWLNREVRDE